MLDDRNIVNQKILNMISRNLIITLVTVFAFSAYAIYKYNANPNIQLLTDSDKGTINTESNEVLHTEGIDKIQLALLLDTSNSMDGLIEQAKSQLWKMVNELASAEQDATDSDIEIALYQYGNSKLSAGNGYIEQIIPLTSDMDLISEKLFELSTQGGEEYCGVVIDQSLLDLDWSDSDKDYKAILIAGNEAFDQGPVSFKQACKKAKNKNVVINTIFCGNYERGVNLNWEAGANATSGQYMVINMGDEVVHYTTPYDDRIRELNSALNNTYIPYGADGYNKFNNQSMQDANANSYGKGNSRTRSFFKSKKQYKNQDWDLVDKIKEAPEPKQMELLSEIAITDPKLQSMSAEELKNYALEKAESREKIKKELIDLESEVKSYIKKEKEKLAKEETETMDHKVIKTIKKQINKKSKTK